MRNSVHSLYDFQINVAIFGEPVPQGVLLDYIFREVGYSESHVFIWIHGRHEVNILDVDGHKAGTWRGDCAAEKDLDGEEICGWCFAIPRLIK